MKKYTLAATVAAVATNAPTAYALNFDFHFPTSSGTVSGEITGLAATGESRGGITILSAPTGIPSIVYQGFFAPGPGYGQYEDAFTVSNGMLVGAHFAAAAFLGFAKGTLSSYERMYLAIDYQHQTEFYYSQSSHKVGPLAVADGPVSYTLTAGSSGSSGGTTSAPEPASIALLGAGLAGIAAFRRRRACA